MAEQTSPKVTGTVYLQNGLSESQVRLLRERILALENVIRVSFKSKRTVMEELSEFVGGAQPDSIAAAELFPDVLELEIRKDTSSAGLIVLKSIVSKYPEISEVDFSEDWLAQYHRVRSVLRIFGIILMVGLLVGCSFIIANFMGMRHQSRRNEIEIVQLVGAEKTFILAPFLWEGFIEGLVGSTFALLVLYLLKMVISFFIHSGWATLLGARGWLYLSPVQGGLVLGVGIAMAFLGSITVFMRFQQES